MSLHPSLKRAERISASRSVMKRVERIKWLQGKGLWKEEDRVLGLPKIKVVKLKAIKKEKKEEAPVEEGVVAAEAVDTKAAAAEKKPAEKKGKQAEKK
ncbi:MAG: small basic protein [Candidatus Omnitrophota bacterium]|nr:MAG: small basic protein [Candidatus Omnitrophota bacterium]